MRSLQSIQAEAPGDVVSYSLKIEGETVPEEVEILSMSICHELNHIPLARLVIRDGDAALEDFETSNMTLFIPGKKLEIFLGHTSNETLVFKGIITAHNIRMRQNGDARLILEARDEAFKMSIGVKRRYATDISDSDLLEEIIEEYGLAVEISPTSIIHSEMVQHHATDWDFVMSRVEMNGMVCETNNGKLKISPPDFSQEPAFSFSYGSEILELDVKFDGRYQYQGVKAISWDAANQELVEIEANEPTVSEVGSLTNEEIAESMGLGTVELLHSGNVGAEELQSWADGKLLKNRLAKVRGRARCEGIVGMLPGQMVHIQGVVDRFNGDVYVSGVKHTIGEGSWLMDIQFGLNPEWFTASFPVSQPPASNMLPAVSGLQVGVVTQIEDDPGGGFRVKVRLPIVDNEDQGVWARVSTLDAGATRGTFFRPEVGDEVVVGFLNDDPRDPVILGGFHSRANPAPFTPSVDNNEKGYVSREGLKMVFKEDDKSITLETPSGNKFQLNEAENGIALEDENGNQIIMNPDGICFRSNKDLKLEAQSDVIINGKNIQIEANLMASVKGRQGTNLESSGTTSIKGTKVMLN